MVKVLGIYFTCDGVAEAMWQRAMERARLVATRIQHLDLTFREQAPAVKTSICAFASYVCRVAVMQSKTGSQLNSIFNTLLWDGKPAPVKQNLLHLPESEGGIGLPHVFTIGRPPPPKLEEILLPDDWEELLLSSDADIQDRVMKRVLEVARRLDLLAI
ncbi:hypothetical protein HPB50_008202 [Hyalomma asiaticum]|uniref:Uncharacterized protein n=1 Tax=Hyalomma asiaticum TaxID=266040 RepID=A0ACB7S139_HYAAI|nr:hypothetical protein HPB50_008202 [Hyalomma asiaticum]